MEARGFEIEEPQVSALRSALHDPQARAWFAFVVLCFHTGAWLASESMVLGFEAWTLVATACTYAVHWAVHVHLGYARRGAGSSRQLSALTLGDGVIALVFLMLALHAVSHPSFGRLGAGLAVLLGVVPLVSARTADLVNSEHGDLSEGDEFVQDLPLVGWVDKLLRPLDSAPVFSQLHSLLRWITPRKQVSAYIIMVISLGLAMLTSFATALGLHKTRPTGQQNRPEHVFNSAVLHPRKRLILGHGLPKQHRSTADEEYVRVCYGWPRPGQPAGPRVAITTQDRQRLYDLFAGGPWSAGYGATAAGCAWYAHSEVQRPMVAWVSGWCGLELRSVAVVWPTGSALMLQQVAVFARFLLQRGLLLSASRRVDVDQGDFQVLHTTYGDVVFIRQYESDGAAVGAQPVGACAAPTSRNVAYVALPPELAVLWAKLVVSRHEWLWPVYDDSRDNRTFDFIMDKQLPVVVARGSCATNGICTLATHGQVQRLVLGTRPTIPMEALQNEARPR